MIFKVDRGVYIIINIAHVTPEKVALFTNWGTYFDCLQNLPVQMPRIKATCPTLYAVLTGDDLMMSAKWRLAILATKVMVWASSLTYPRTLPS